jgi:hypothetical protein
MREELIDGKVKDRLRSKAFVAQVRTESGHLLKFIETHDPGPSAALGTRKNQQANQDCPFGF